MLLTLLLKIKNSYIGYEQIDGLMKVEFVCELLLGILGKSV